ncbi:carboxypeptidase-like regulatory domain-containing protein [Flavobacterium aestuarii]|uniref:carboxypeptidase-like regulatory domain-containing protein n=1 Tax=Flavobacterium aestuarii TaxID=3149227 RepID=UPI0032B469BE
MKTIYKKLLFLLLLLPFCAIAQNKVEGTVLDNVSGQPIPGVNVKIEGGTSGVSTDFDGKFQLTNVKPTDVLNISYMGYTTRTVTVGNQKSLIIKLQEDSNQL